MWLLLVHRRGLSDAGSDHTDPHQDLRRLPQQAGEACAAGPAGATASCLRAACRLWGHLGFAYGLVSGLLVLPQRCCGIVYANGGTGADPGAHPGSYFSFPIWEEKLQALLWAEALRA